MKHQLVLVFAAGLSFPFTALPQGSLTPPGPPGPTMKSLTQLDAKLEKRTPIASAGPTVNITSPGSYYLTKDIPFTGNGLVITADNVTIDLNGFTLSGTGSGNVTGIQVSGAHRNIVIHNGTVRFFGANGIDANSAADCRFENLSVLDNKGIGAFAGAAATVTRCKFVSNGSFGLSGNAGCYIGESNAKGNKGAGIQTGSDSTVTRCIASGTINGNGIYVGSNSQVTYCNATNNSGTGIAANNYCSIVNCTASSLQTRGISVVNGCSVIQCTAGGNKEYGIYTENGATVSACTATGQSIGIRVGDNSTVNGCTASANTFDGIQAVNACVVMNNNASGNVSPDQIAHGIHLYGARNRVDTNMATNNGAGILSAAGTGSGADFIIRNIAANNGIFLGLNYSPSSSNNSGPTDKQPSTATSPWANFQ